MSRLWIRIGILVLVVVGGLVVRPWLSGNAADLQVGECFDVSPSDATVKSVQHHPCTEAHNAEAFFVGNHPAAKDAAYPSQDEMVGWVAGVCTPAFTAYTGLDPITDATWSYGFFYPSADTWGKGNRSVVCYAARIDDTQVTGSIRKP